MRALFKTKLREDDRLKLAPETRLGLTVAASLAALVISDTAAAALLLAASMLYFFLQARLKAIVVIYLVFAALALAALGCFWLMGFIFAPIKNSPLSSVFMPFARLAISINMIAPLALHSSLSGLVGTVNRLRLWGVVKLPLIVTIRFIPTFLNDLMQIREAVRLRFRGRGGFFFWLARPRLWWRVFFMPLVVRLIRSADELAVAAELKGLSAETDFGRPPLALKRADALTASAGVFILAATGFLQVLYAAG